MSNSNELGEILVSIRNNPKAKIVSRYNQIVILLEDALLKEYFQEGLNARGIHGFLGYLVFPFFYPFFSLPRKIAKK